MSGRPRFNQTFMTFSNYFIRGFKKKHGANFKIYFRLWYRQKQTTHLRQILLFNSAYNGSVYIYEVVIFILYCLQPFQRWYINTMDFTFTSLHYVKGQNIFNGFFLCSRPVKSARAEKFVFSKLMYSVSTSL